MTEIQILVWLPSMPAYANVNEVMRAAQRYTNGQQARDVCDTRALIIYLIPSPHSFTCSRSQTLHRLIASRK